MVLNPLSVIFEKSELTPLLQEIKQKANISIEGITASSFSLIISSVFQRSSEQVLVITKNSQSMQELYLDLSSFIDSETLNTLPPWETLPYEFVSPSESVERERISTILNHHSCHVKFWRNFHKSPL